MGGRPPFPNRTSSTRRSCFGRRAPLMCTPVARCGQQTISGSAPGIPLAPRRQSILRRLSRLSVRSANRWPGPTSRRPASGGNPGVGIAFTWVILYGGQFAGELTVWRIVWGSCRSAELGYWIDARFAGRGIMPTALAMGVDHCFQVMGMHRLEAGIRPENAASRRVVEKLGFRDEGIRVRQVHIDGAWRDHICYAITAEEIPTGMLCQWRSSLASSRA